MSQKIKQTFSSLYKGKTNSEKAASQLKRNCTKEELAEYLVDAFDRGWITRFNIGLDSEGNIV